ncbi:MAG: transcriptional regulator NrdR [Veillonellaceae bacterium]|nr:transcriptional regulator NrdR [Veillonellaceae bacterium]
MRCPYCEAADTKVMDSRATDDGNSIRRRRLCQACGRRFTTYEVIEEQPLMVVKRDGRKELFSTNKIFKGVMQACSKRNLPLEKIEAIGIRVEAKLRDEGAVEVPTERIGEMILDELKQLDQVAYIRFAAVYRKFDNIDTFIQELERLK